MMAGGEAALAGGEAALTGTSMMAVSGSVLVVASGREGVRIACSVVGMVSQEVERGLVVVSGSDIVIFEVILLTTERKTSGRRQNEVVAGS